MYKGRKLLSIIIALFIIVLSCANLSLVVAAEGTNSMLVNSKGELCIPSYLSDIPQSTAVLESWDSKYNGKTVYNLIRESMVMDVEACMSYIKKNIGVMGINSLSTGRSPLQDSSNARNVQNNIYCFYEYWWLGLQDYVKAEKQLFVDTDGTEADNCVAHSFIMQRWGYLLNALAAGDIDLAAIDDTDLYLNFMNGETLYSFRLPRKDGSSSAKYPIDGCNLDNNQIIRLAWYEAFAEYTYAIYTFKSDNSKFTTLTSLNSHLDALKEEDVVLEAFVHPILGVVPCIYDKNVDINGDTNNDLYIKSMAQFIDIFFKTGYVELIQAKYKAGLTAAGLEAPLSSSKGVPNSIRYAYEAMLSKDRQVVMYRNFYRNQGSSSTKPGETGATVTDGTISKRLWYNAVSRVSCYPFLFYPDTNYKSVPAQFTKTIKYSALGKSGDSDKGFQLTNVAVSTIYISPEYMMMWAYAHCKDFSEKLGFIGTSISKSSPSLYLIQPYSYDINGSATEVQAKVLFNTMLPITYINEWNDTNLYGVYSYTDTLWGSETNIEDLTVEQTDTDTIFEKRIKQMGNLLWDATRNVKGLTDLSSFMTNDGSRYLGDNTKKVEALKKEYNKNAEIVKDTLTNGNIVMPSGETVIAAYEMRNIQTKIDVLTHLLQTKLRHLNYSYGSDRGVIYISDKAGLEAQPDAYGNTLVGYDKGQATNFVTVASKFDTPYFYCIADGKVYSGKASQLYNYYFDGYCSSTYMEKDNDSRARTSIVSNYTGGLLNWYEVALDGAFVTPQNFSVRMETVVLPTNKLTQVSIKDGYSSALVYETKNYNSDICDDGYTDMLDIFSTVVQSYQKHLILIPNTMNECITDVWQFKKVTNATKGTVESANVQFYVETGRSLTYTYDNIESLDLVTPNQNVKYTRTSMGDAQGSFYSKDGRLSLSTPMPLKQEMLFLTHGVAILVSPYYIDSSGLLEWLQTSDAANFVNANTETTGYTVTTLYKRLISQGVSLGGTDLQNLEYDDITRFEEISNELSLSNSLKAYEFVFIILNVLGLCVVAYGVLLVVAYFIDMLDTFTNISILNIITFGGLRAVHTAQELTDMGITGAERKKYVTRNGILLRWAVCTIIGIMLATSNQLIIWAITLFNIVMSWF